jgi:hypothetical protein
MPRKSSAALKVVPKSAPPKYIAPKGAAYIQYIALSHLAKWPRNPKKHDIDGLTASFNRFGAVAPIVIDEKSNKIVAGHGRQETLIGMRERGEERPRNVFENSGEWYAPVLRGISFKNEAEAEGYLIADNRHVETGGWDNEVLRLMMERFKNDQQLEAIGFTHRELDILLKPIVIAPGPTPDQKLVGFMASEIKQIVLMLPHSEYEHTLARIAAVMDKQKLKSHTEAFLFLLQFYESRSR